MVLCNVECIEKITEYLGLPRRKFHASENNTIVTENLINSKTTEGFSTIVQALAKASKSSGVLGRDKVERALTKQWLEYAVLYLNYGDVPANWKRILKELNSALQRNTYICGTNLTIADIVIYYTLHSIMKGLSVGEKAECVNVSRWFDNVQQDEKLRQKLEPINFDLLYLYI